MALDTINKCLSEAICALSRGRLDGESQTASLIHSGNEILEMDKYYPEVRLFTTFNFLISVWLSFCSSGYLIHYLIFFFFYVHT